MDSKEYEVNKSCDKIALSFDIDWAPDFVIDFTAQILVRNNIKATWFITHKSEAVERLFKYPELFDLGVHPNFLEHSTQGRNKSEIMNFVMNIVPDAKTVRTHGMYYSAEISKLFAQKYGLKFDSSIYLKEMPDIRPQNIYYEDNLLIRLPYFWEESGEMMNPKPSFNIGQRLDYSGLKIFDFHPIHIFLNSKSMKNYNNLKKSFDLNVCLEKDIQPFVNKGLGARTLLLDLIEQVGFDIDNIARIGDSWIK